jgi:ATP-dependent RNA helicase RhlE
MSFENLGLSSSLLKAIQEKGYKIPSPIQAQAIPAILKKGDLMACAQTGTGKTAGFTLPLLEILSLGQKSAPKAPRALILAPTRELAAQIQESIQDYGKHLNLSSTVVYGGVKIGKQILRLQNSVDILVATPGRLLDLHNQRAVSLNKVEILVLDEADRMLDMGFINDIKKILSYLPKERQNLLFSATFSNDIRKFAKGLLHNPVEINVAPANTTANNIEHKIHPVDKTRKAELLSHLIRVNNWQQALVFSRTKHGANRLVQRLAQDRIEALAIHGNKSQAQRQLALSSFKAGKIKILVATDIAARGIDIDQLPQVVNFDLPSVPEDYVHRIGRTGRAGASGKAISLFSVDEFKQLNDIEKVLKSPIKREVIAGFEPSMTRPEPSEERAPQSRPYNYNRGPRSYSSSRPQQNGRSSSGNFRNNSSR